MKKFLSFLLCIGCSFFIFSQQTKDFTGISLIKIEHLSNDAKFIIGENVQSITDEREIQPFYMNAFETSYIVWYNIRTEAEKTLSYTFQNPGQEGSKGKRGKPPTEEAQWQPVTTINWRDAIVWCNALSELEGRTPCYTYNEIVLRDSTNAAQIDLCTCNYQANGYRLPTETEWEYAARKNGALFQPGNVVSGVMAESNDTNSNNLENDYCWNDENSTGTANIGTTGSLFGAKSSPGSGNPNKMGLFDMSGNVLEFCNDWYEEYYKQNAFADNIYYDGPKYGSARIVRGGSWSPFASYCYCGDRYAFDPDESYNYMGFRFCTTKE
ncbi:MAG: hypothetical protein BKP49_05350 [Treponema sp. CETP13]|nr:MAG: hypothetical protein BKP49_05350 [Treponema sp. CETP13]